MNLKKIEMYGFKSFADRITVEFTDNITAIVGPNGCGKSNVADAIRWVFGVQAPSAIRCSTMTDLIFNGTSSRRPLSYAEVSIFLENEDRKYLIDFDEVVITRKLYRNGDSEYLINNNTCRLKDIIELFRDTGIGKEGYSIIAQGMVQSLVTAKSEDRRKIFEEAAGIAKFRARKEETERKLVKTRDNLLRLNDHKTTIEAQLSPLEKQAKDAIKSNELREELRVLEINNYLYQCDNNAKIKGAIEDGLKKTRDKIERLETEQSELLRDYNLKMTDRENMDIFATKLHDDKSNLMVEQASKAGEGRLIAEKITNLQAEIQRKSEILATSSTRIDDREEELRKNSREKEEKNAAFIATGLSYEKLSRELSAMSDAVVEKEREVDRSTELIMNSQDELTGIKTDAVKLIATRDMLLENAGVDKEAIHEKRMRLNAAERQLQTLQQELSEMRTEAGQKDDDIVKAETNISACRRELNDCAERKLQMNGRMTEIAAKIKWNDEAKRQMQGYLPAVRFLVGKKSTDAELDRRIVGVVGEMITVPRDLSLAIEVALGGAVNNLIVNTPEDASRLIEILHQNKAGRATFLPLSALRYGSLDDDRILDEDGVLGLADELIRFDKKIYAAISHLLGRVVVVENRAHAIRISKKYNNSVRMVTLDGSLFAVGGAITGGDSMRSDGKVLSRDNETDDLKKKLNSVQKEFDMLANDIRDKEEELENLTRASKVLQAQKDKVSVAMATIEANILSGEADINAVKAEMDRLIGQSAGVLEKVKGLELQIAALTANEGNATSKKVEAGDYLAALRDELRAFKDKRDEKQREYNGCLVKLNGLKTELDNLDSETVRLKQELQQLHMAMAEATTQKKVSERALEDAQNKVDTTVFSQEDREKLDQIKRQLEEIDEYKKRLAEEIAQNNERREVIQKDLSGLNERRAKDEMKLERLDSDVETLAVRIRDEYNLGYDEAILYRTDEFDADTASAEILKKKRKIDSIGPVNALAVEQFEETKARFEELSMQFDDLIKAEQDLLKVIADLTRDMEMTFSEKFRQIGDNFQLIFKELFGGGSGKLELDTSAGGGILEAGIVIKAAPPGKNLKHLTLLSGGEQTLTAIAILFSIIKLNPLPFCVLDEVEAALDDANAQLFARYLKRFSDTQFILITHKKPSMESAGTLHGITMQEKGVSARVSVQLKDAQKYTME